ncbi:DUF202 domain-containing protein [Actinokineospora inagensis]|uniref:DUF202 domain-containing protein n=1 Tax=Actinokineospora inagensis TaxID=103730 RepID=UPI00041F0C93|nr:DUF202 domain-containing protein [Actinokineospora inagensis]
MTDRGLQAERTRLAWTRTGLSCAAVGALLMHGHHGFPGLVGGLAVMTCALTMVLCGAARYRKQDRPLPAWTGLLAVAPGVVTVLTLLSG